jgi:hypothetical protein
VYSCESAVPDDPLLVEPAPVEDVAVDFPEDPEQAAAANSGITTVATTSC